MQQIDLPCGNAEHQPCIFHIDHHNPFTRAQRSTGAAETGVEDCTVAWLFITNGSGDAFAQTE